MPSPRFCVQSVRGIGSILAPCIPDKRPACTGHRRRAGHWNPRYKPPDESYKSSIIAILLLYHKSGGGATAIRRRWGKILTENWMNRPKKMKYKRIKMTFPPKSRKNENWGLPSGGISSIISTFHFTKEQRDGRLAQLVEHALDVRRVSGSIPLASTTPANPTGFAGFLRLPRTEKPPSFVPGRSRSRFFGPFPHARAPADPRRPSLPQPAKPNTATGSVFLFYIAEGPAEAGGKSADRKICGRDGADQRRHPA